jgi:hypothetical protein
MSPPRQNVVPNAMPCRQQGPAVHKFDLYKGKGKHLSLLNTIPLPGANVPNN